MHNKPGARKKFDLICDFCFIFPGKQVGRVPANLCRAFRMITERQLCTELTCVYNNSVGVSREPRPDQSFERILLLIETCPEVVQSSSVATSLLFRVATLKK